jgi:bifunctional non-homologous end joining protein LigD
MSTLTFGKMAFQTSNEDKVLFPDAGYTKGDLIEYYEAVATTMLPHVKNRPLTLVRYPNGVGKPGFFQKSVPDHYPDWIKTVTLKKEDGKITHVCANNAATLAYLANQAAVELHTQLARADDVGTPDLLVFDLDPSGDDFEIVRETAFWLYELLSKLGLHPYVKTTGSRGVHVATPLRGDADFDQVKDFARDVADYLVSQHPAELTTELRKAKRKGRLFIDILRNAYSQTAVAPYSVRAKGNGPVATPIEWDELKEPDMGPQSFDIKSVIRRIETSGDPWKDMHRHGKSLVAPMRKLKSMLR